MERKALAEGNSTSDSYPVLSTDCIENLCAGLLSRNFFFTSICLTVTFDFAANNSESMPQLQCCGNEILHLKPGVNSGSPYTHGEGGKKPRSLILQLKNKMSYFHSKMI